MSQVFLDIRTLTFVLMLTTMFLSTILIFIWRNHKTYSGFGFWAISHLTVSIGILLLGLRGTLSDFLSVLMANTLIFGGLMLSFEGFRRFRGLTDQRFLSFSLVLVQIPLLGYYTYLEESVIARIIINSMMNASVGFLCAYELLRNRSKEWLSVYWQGAIVFILFSLFTITRAVLTYHYSQISNLFTADWIQSVFFTGNILFSIAWSFCYIMLNSERTQKELQATQIELERIASTDFLTGINNSRRFFEISNNEIVRATRFRHPLGVIMFDIDYFKNVNDTYGHAAGDKVLIKLAEISRTSFRKIDTLGRIGGEEFAVLLPHTNLQNSLKVAEFLRRKIEESEIEFNGEIIRVTASFGVAELSDSDTHIKTILDRADNSLYEAKRKGRNQVVANA